MIVRTYTNMWSEEKKLYAIHEVTLPTPVGFKQIGLFFVGLIIWVPIMFAFSVPISHWMGFTLWFSVPVALAIFGGKKLFEGKGIFQYLGSVVGFVFEPKRVLDGGGISATTEQLPNEKTGNHDPITVKYTAWTQTPLGKV